MPNYTGQHAYYGGVDLHARSLFLHVCDPAGQSDFLDWERPDPVVLFGPAAALRGTQMARDQRPNHPGADDVWMRR